MREMVVQFPITSEPAGLFPSQFIRRLDFSRAIECICVKDPRIRPIRQQFGHGPTDLESCCPFFARGKNGPARFEHQRMPLQGRLKSFQLLNGLTKISKFKPSYGCPEALMRSLWELVHSLASGARRKTRVQRSTTFFQWKSSRVEAQRRPAPRSAVPIEPRKSS